MNFLIRNVVLVVLLIFSIANVCVYVFGIYK